MPHWTVQVYPTDVIDRPDNPARYRLGQNHCWFFLKIKPDVTIDLTTATTDEFSDFRWTTFEDVITEAEEYRNVAYRQVYQYFKEYIK